MIVRHKGNTYALNCSIASARDLAERLLSCCNWREVVGEEGSDVIADLYVFLDNCKGEESGDA